MSRTSAGGFGVARVDASHEVWLRLLCPRTLVRVAFLHVLLQAVFVDGVARVGGARDALSVGRGIAYQVAPAICAALARGLLAVPRLASLEGPAGTS